MIQPSKILVVRFSSIGDIVLTSPVIRLLRKAFPESEIDFVAKRRFSDLVRHDPNLNFTYEYDPEDGIRGLWHLSKRLNEKRYELVLDLHNSIRSRLLCNSIHADRRLSINKHIFKRTMLVWFKKNLYTTIVSTVDRYSEPLKSLGIKIEDDEVSLSVPPQVTFRIERQLSPIIAGSKGPMVGFCPSAKHATKRWPAERYAEVGRQLVERSGATIFLFGGNDDDVLCDHLVNAIGRHAYNFAGRFALLETAAAMAHCRVVLTNDTGLMHVATAMKREVIAIFGSTVRQFGFFPHSQSAVVIENEHLGCRPCSHIGKAACPKKHFRCMLDIGTHEVLAAIQQRITT
jgi:heptosyltransferase-2